MFRQLLSILCFHWGHALLDVSLLLDPEDEPEGDEAPELGPGFLHHLDREDLPREGV